MCSTVRGERDPAPTREHSRGVDLPIRFCRAMLSLFFLSLSLKHCIAHMYRRPRMIRNREFSSHPSFYPAEGQMDKQGRRGKILEVRWWLLWKKRVGGRKRDARCSQMIYGVRKWLIRVHAGSCSCIRKKEKKVLHRALHNMYIAVKRVEKTPGDNT
jgi:hypothetical protein